LKANGVSGGEVAVTRAGLSWTTAVGIDTSINTANTVDTRVDIWSITKTFTAALVFQAADQKLINLDAPLPKLTAVPDFPYAGKITPRQLLAHRTGLINYRDTPTYTANPNSIDSAAKAVTDVGTQPLHFAPGTQTEYSSSNYLVLGLLLEQVTGKSYDTLVTALEQQANLGDIPHTPPYGGSPNFSTGGLKPTTMQLAQWGLALLRDNTPGLSTKDLTDMMALDPDSSIGQGVWGYCPCTTDAQGKHHWTAFGHGGAVSQLEYAPADQTSIAVNIDASIYVPDNRQDQLNQLFIDLRRIADAG
jgi:CubicO group peptidase (beta-lactamase class C family)